MEGQGLVKIYAAVEGPVDEAVVRRLAREVSANAATVYGKKGKHDLKRRITGYNEAARFAPWLVLVDLDQDADCAPHVKRVWLSMPSPKMCFRVAVRAVEAWLMADQGRLARFLGVQANRVPRQPDLEENPKQTMIRLCTMSRRRDIRQDMLARPGSGREVGPAYTSRLIEFTQSLWCPAEAADSSDSLLRCLKRLRDLVGQAQV